MLWIEQKETMKEGGDDDDDEKYILVHVLCGQIDWGRRMTRKMCTHVRYSSLGFYLRPRNPEIKSPNFHDLRVEAPTLAWRVSRGHYVPCLIQEAGSNGYQPFSVRSRGVSVTCRNSRPGTVLFVARTLVGRPSVNNQARSSLRPGTYQYSTRVLVPGTGTHRYQYQ